jgi:ferredoxin-NADP reductase
MSARLIMKLQLVEKTLEAPDVVSLVFKHPRRPELPQSEAGAHVDVHIPDLGIRQYSLCGGAGGASTYRIAVRREESGRGGSSWIHSSLKVGDIIPVSAPRSNFPLSKAKKHVFIAGGIGITPFLAMASEAGRRGEEFEVHYCVRSRPSAAFVDELSQYCGNRLHLYAPSEGRFDAARLFAALNSRSDIRVYGCGPAKLLEAVETAAEDQGWPSSRLHFERFQAAVDENFVPESFDLTIGSTGQKLHVAKDRSALQVLKENGFNLQASCEVGICGSCRCNYVEGDVLHRDTILSREERVKSLTLCVSRARGSLVLDL